MPGELKHGEPKPRGLPQAGHPSPAACGTGDGLWDAVLEGLAPWGDAAGPAGLMHLHDFPLVRGNIPHGSSPALAVPGQRTEDTDN